MVIVDPVTMKQIIPWRGFHVFASVFVPFDVGFVTQNACAGFFDVGARHERTDIEADAVVQIGIPADGLLRQRFPAHEDGVGGIAHEDQFEAVLEHDGRIEAILCPRGFRVDLALLLSNPIAEIGVDEAFERLARELVVVDEHREAVLCAVPDLPDKRSMPKHRAMLLKKPVPQPTLERLALAVAVCEQGFECRVGPLIAISTREHAQEAICGRLLAMHRRNADDTVVVYQIVELR